MNERKIKIGDEWLTYLHYKEPLEKISKNIGFGYYGTLLSTLDKDKIQCHICGKLFKDVGRHVLSFHRDRTLREYREKFKLAYKTSLISESERLRRKEIMQERYESMTRLEKEELIQKTMAGLRKWQKENPGEVGKQPKLTLETKNKRGTCPQQLLSKIKEVKDKLNKVPSLKEFVKETKTQRYKHLIFTIFGSWNNALKALNYATIDPTQGFSKKYTREELIEYLKAYFEIHKKPPTYSDFKRHLLPSRGVYYRHFGTLDNAIKEAGII